MKRILALFLSIVMLFTGCSQAQQTSQLESQSVPEPEVSAPIEFKETVPEFTSLDDENLLSYVENLVYRDTVTSLNNEEYFVENVSTVYISKEYLEEVAFNSQTNIYFGYNLADLNELFQGTRYVFTLGENGETTVQELVEIEDVTAETILKNVAIGTGVILICVTVSVLTHGAGAVATPSFINLIFTASATSAKSFAISSAFFGGAASGIIRYIQTGDTNEALKAFALSGSEGFKWGAISGSFSGALSTTVKYIQIIRSLKGVELQGLTAHQAAVIQMDSKYPLDIIKQFHTMDEYLAFKSANLKPSFIGNKSALIKTDIDLKRVDAKGRTNLERMQEGLAPLDSEGLSYELHHVGQKKDGTLAILTRKEHDNAAIHGFLEKTEAHAEGTNWDADRKAFWKAFAKLIG